MKRHKKDKHKKESNTPRRLIYKCDECEFEAENNASFNTHIRNEHKSILYKCEECDFEDNDKQKLMDHKRSNHKQNSRDVKCDECDFSTDSKETLRQHMKVAMGHKVKRTCKYFLNNTCKFGSMCRYLHTTNMNSQYGSQKKQLVQPNKQCKFYGRCSKFPNCGFAHDELCKFQDKCFKNRCQYVHLSGSFLEQWKRTSVNRLIQK